MPAKYTIRTPRPQTRLGPLERELNAQQLTAVTSGPGIMLVLAGAGTGKTRTLTYRAAHLIANGLDPNRLMLCTFTNRAAREMIRRVENLLEAQIRMRWAGTFHHIANLALRRHAQRLSLDENYSILDREDARDLMASCIAEEGAKLLTRRFPNAVVLLRTYSTMINCQLSVEQVLRRDAPSFIDQNTDIERIFERYGQRKLRLGFVDYDDLLAHMRTLLVDHPSVKQSLSQQFEHVLVDEYQDTNRLQVEIVDLCIAEHGNLVAVGDDAQSIYGFRGADVTHIVDFKKRHPTASINKLETNYRSTPEILRLANTTIRQNNRQIPKTLRASRPNGQPAVLLPLEDEAQQAAFVAQRVLELNQQNDIPLSNMAVLYRAHAHSLEIQLELTRRKIPFSVRSGLRFFEQAHIKDVLSFLRLAHNRMDILAWQRLLKLWPAVGKKSASIVLEALLEQTSNTESPVNESVVAKLPPNTRKSVDKLSALIKRMSDEPSASVLLHTALEEHYREYAQRTYPNATQRLEDIVQLADYASRYEHKEAFLSELSLVEGFAAESPGPGQLPDEALILSTIHQAKGLEWKAVFLIGLADGCFPQAMALRTNEELEEERRLFYVAVTRAKDELYMCHPRFYEPANGPRRILRLSRFVRELGTNADAPYETWEIEQC